MDDIKNEDATELEQTKKLYQDLLVQHEQTLLVNSDLQARVEVLELAQASNGVVSKPEAAKPKIPEKSFKVKFEGADKDFGELNGEYLFTIPRFTNPLDSNSPVTAEEALTNKDLLQHLVKIGFGGIKRKGAK